MNTIELKDCKNDGTDQSYIPAQMLIESDSTKKQSESDTYKNLSPDVKAYNDNGIIMTDINILNKVDIHQELDTCTAVKKPNAEGEKGNHFSLECDLVNLQTDAKELKEIKKSELAGCLLNPVRFWGIVFWISINQFSWGFNQAFIGSFIITLANKKNFDWESGSAEYSQNVSLLSSLFFLGTAGSNITLNLFLKYNQKNFLAGCELMVILLTGVLLIKNDISFITGRLIIGYVNGLQNPTGQSLLFQLTPPSLRQRSLTFYSMCLPTGILTVMIWGYLDNEGIYWWRLTLLFQIIPSLVYIILAFTYFRDIDMPTNMIKNGKNDELRLLMSSYMKESYVIFMIKNFNQIIETENEQKEKTKGRKCGELRFLASYYNKELVYGILTGVLVASTMFNCFYSFA